MRGGKRKIKNWDYFMQRVNKSESGCWEWTKKLSGGYGRVNFAGEMIGAHCLMYQLFVAPIPDGMFVLHKCDNRKCINPEHLELGTQAKNMRDATIRNRIAYKTNPEVVKEIRWRYEQGFTQVQIAKMFNLNQSYVGQIINRKVRKYVE